MRHRTRSSGFTLLEVVIAVTLMAFLSYFTAQAIQRALKAKTKIQSDIDRNVALREALNFMVRDIQLAFNYRDVSIELFNAAQKQNVQAPRQTQTPNQGGAPQPPVETPRQRQQQAAAAAANAPEQKEDKLVTQFIGDEKKIDFASLSRIRSQQDEAVSNQSEVGYYLDDCTSRKDRKRRLKCLWRRSSPYIDEEPTEGGSAAVLLENVASLSFRYLGPEHEEEWVRAWRSDGQLEEVMKGQFPYAVEITLEVFDDRFKPPHTLAMTRTAEIRFPNDKKKEQSNGTENGQTGTDQNP